MGAIVRKLQIVMYFPEDEVIKQGDPGLNLYFLEKGGLKVFILDEYNRESFVKDLTPGTMFGELAVIFNSKRTASVRSKNFSTCSSLEKSDFDEIVKSYPNILPKFK